MLGLEKYIARDEKTPESADRTNLTIAELEEQKRRKDGDAKAHTRIELAIGYSDMIHISGAETTREIWNQLIVVKES